MDYVMKYWDAVLEEVLDKKQGARKISLTNVREAMPSIMSHDRVRVKKPKLIKRYYLYDHDGGGVYFTRREAECMSLLLAGNTVKEAARRLLLSPRTVEFYLKNMKEKAGCRTKAKLIRYVLSTEFNNAIDFIID